MRLFGVAIVLLLFGITILVLWRSTRGGRGPLPRSGEVGIPQSRNSNDRYIS